MAGVTVVITLMVASDLLLLTLGLQGALWSELLLVLLPAVLVGLGLSGPVAETFSLRPPRPTGVAAALVLAPAAFVGLSALLALECRLVPIPPATLEAMVVLQSEASRRPLLAALALAWAPAVAEEALFRGVLLTWLLRSRPAFQAITAQAVLFALFHRSAWRVLPMLLFGFALGWLVSRGGSIWPAVLAHLGYNQLVLWSPGWLEQAAAHGAGWLTAGGVGVAALWLAGHAPSRKSPSSEFT